MKLKEKQESIRLRKLGYSVNEIQRKLGVAKSSVSIWIRNVPLSPNAQERLERKLTLGQLRSREVLRKRGDARRAHAYARAHEIVSKFKTDKSTNQILCAMLYWCEGGKSETGCVSFTNSDAALVATFLGLLRKSFSLDENKFRVCMHLHEYHVEGRQGSFWSRVTGIPEVQFMKSYRKKSGWVRFRAGYEGCVNIRYFDVQLLRILKAIAQEYMRGPIG